MTIEEFARLPGDGVQHEMSDGVLITTPFPKSLHTRITVNVLEILHRGMRQQTFGVFPGAGYLLRSAPLTIRQPDVSVLSKQRIKATGPDAYFQGSPELAIEVVSPGNDAEDLELKIAQYSQYGAIQVWMLYPKTQSVHVFEAGGSRILTAPRILDGGPVLPGFSVAVSDLFAV